jgi:hypothetical protein
MSWVITGSQPFPAVIGEEFGGGYFAGYISHTADGNATHALIVAPRATGATGTGYTRTTSLAWKTANTTTAGTTSDFDGVANTAAMVTAGIADHPAAEFCVDLSIGGFTDWYLPSRYENEIAYFNLKRGTSANDTTAGTGTNPYSVPRRDSDWTTLYPAQTTVGIFASGTEGFEQSLHWTSTENSSTQAWYINHNGGIIKFNFNKVGLARVRAFRRIAL